jgi:cardiolipin synthase
MADATRQLGEVRRESSEPAPGPPVTAPEAPRVVVAGNELRIYTDAPALIAALVEDIRKAKRRVWIEIYTILDDAGGRLVAEALEERARAGVEVRLLYDAVGSLTTPSAFFRSLEEAGVQVHAFHSLWEAFWNLSWLRVLNRRNHRKLAIIDDQVAYFGGMNLGFQGAEGEGVGLTGSSGWRDVHVRLTGPRQGDVVESMDRAWRLAHGERIAARPAAYRRGVLDASDEEGIQFFDTGPGLRHSRSSRIFTRLFRAARRRLTFSMAYFVPVGVPLRELVRAHRRGVFVQVVIPGESDVPMVARATRYLYRTLLRRRFHLYERQLYMLHSKVLIVDERWTVLGSANLDARSLWINLEFMAVIRSKALAQVMREMVKREIQDSRRVTPQEYGRLGRVDRFCDMLAWSLRWWL